MESLRGLLEGVWGPLGRRLGSFGRPSGMSWAVLGGLGVSWGLLGPSWRRLGAVLGLSLEAFGVSRGLLGPSWGCLGASLRGFFPSGSRLGGDVAYDVIFGVVSESFGEGFSLIFDLKMGSS